ncbi:hypothetical protein NCAS_0H00520 [Naumovozyma castellii]|uniref:Phospholipid scramblase n=1 Tax=Naumovozyma castellii TaxID=27288 RepID=G0VIN6_NAUCA|nr:hypothetical protein NCAS_0H00520 [Naumovozyma castellii CBS 4309]CCC71362.1 hypothetical protein NCAS_0H00520 [Naumovozyma castellii CBS 4309]
MQRIFSRLLSTRAFKRRPTGTPRIIDILPQSSLSRNTIIQPHHDVSTSFLNEPTLIIERQIEMMNVFLGYEQANKYVVLDVMGNRLGYMMERDLSIWKSIMRQFYKLHRPFVVDVFDNWNRKVLTIRRPFSWINSHIKALLPSPEAETSMDEDEVLVGESVQNWHLWRRRYELFEKLNNAKSNELDQFGEIDAPFLSFDFPVLDAKGKVLASVDRNWVGLGRELFTDTGVYIVRFDSQQSFQGVYPPESMSKEVLNFDQRAVLLANAVSIDFDYFSRHSRTSGGLISFGGDYE